MRDFGLLRDDLNKSTAAFLRIDLETALTLVRIASEAPAGSEKRLRNVRNARTAHDTVQRIRFRIEMTDQEEEEFKGKMAKLRKALEGFGESFG